MRVPLTLAVAQPRCHPHDVESNALEHATIVARAGARLVVFPELSLTGYHFDAAAVSTDDPRLAPLIGACEQYNATALVGAPVDSTGGRQIAVMAVDGHGASTVYRKMYLGTAEADVFTAGIEPEVLRIDDWRIGLAICRDTGVAAHADATADLGIDIYAAGVLESSSDAAVQPDRARAVVDRHRVWVAVASFAGSTGQGYHRAAGGSAIWASDGRAVASAGPEPGAWVSAVLTDTRASN